MRVFTILVVILWAVSLVGCANLNRDSAPTAANTLVVIGVSLDGLPVQRLGHHYQFNLVNAAGQEFQFTRQLRTIDRFVTVEGLPPGDWTWQSFSARTTPGVSGFDPISARARPVLLEFSLAEGDAVMLSQQLLISHEEGISGRAVANPRNVPLQSTVQARITQWLNSRSADYRVELTPVGTLNVPETEPRPSVFDLLFGA